jgi:uncharacterized protein (DUF924 family)
VRDELWSTRVSGLHRVAPRILELWFGALDDHSVLDPSVEPFRSHYLRWYGKRAEVDAELALELEPVLRDVVAAGSRWTEEVAAWSSTPESLLALLVLLDQIPRNVHRGTGRMYGHDALALSIAWAADEARRFEGLPLVHRMFGLVPFLHAEDTTIQEHAVVRFEALAAEARARAKSPGFFERALDSARKHRDVVREHGRFPHRNAIVGRSSTPAEAIYLAGPDPGF